MKTAAGGCAAVSTTASVTITTAPTATISYTGTPFCTSVSTASVNVSGTGAYTGGTFSAPAGLTINSSTGAITPSSSTAGTYTVT
ncbi:putative Ig domain-containing protein, partial [Salmonella sp. SAL4356]|uniref:putative Ig domain-containing protein n=1 Tax=Salmonella sp. SAL4356 TaxID=3159877 RepID=UPI00397A6440